MAAEVTINFAALKRSKDVHLIAKEGGAVNMWTVQIAKYRIEEKYV